MTRIVRLILRLLLRVEVRGLENIPAADKPAVLIANHLSLLDGPLLQIFLPVRLRFAISALYASHPVMRFAKRTVLGAGAAAASGVRELMREAVTDANHIVIFPEGRVSDTGGLMKIYPGATVFAEKLTGGICVPVHISGTGMLPFFARGSGRRRWLPKIVITVGKPAKLATPAHLRGSARRRAQEHALRRILEKSAFEAGATADINLTRYLVHSAKRHGARRTVFEDVVPSPRKLSYRTLLRTCYALAPILAARHGRGERVALLLPSSAGSAAVFWSCQFARTVPVMLNLGASSKDLSACCRNAQASTVYTSGALLEKAAHLRDAIGSMRSDGLDIVLLEDLRAQIPLARKLMALAFSLFPEHGLLDIPGGAAEPEADGAILFTSGSEGLPKGVVLSQRNLIANCEQILARIPVSDSDSMLNALPVFHSFGLIGGIILPVGGGLRCVQYPTPLHFDAIAEHIYDNQTTIFFSTSTFLGRYAAAAHPTDFVSLRLIFAGGEKLRESVARIWLDKFGKRVLEGYGVTETSPALALCSVWEHKPGSIGPLLAGVEARLVPVEGIAEGGELMLRGPNVMAGYLHPEQPGKLVSPADGWHNTGDVVTVDDDGFYRIIGRTKRFAKIAGEMVAPGRVEETLGSLFGEKPFAVLTIPDKTRGEALVIVHGPDIASPALSIVREAVEQAGIPPLWAPRDIVCLTEFALLPTGKPDHVKLTAELSKLLAKDKDANSNKTLAHPRRKRKTS